MLKAFDDLERAVGRLVERTRDRAPDSSVSKATPSSVDEIIIASQTTDSSEQPNVEAAELIRRAIKRLRSL